MSLTCPACEMVLELGDVEDGEIFTCPSCGTEFEVVKRANTVELMEVFIDGEDWGE